MNKQMQIFLHMLKTMLNAGLMLTAPVFGKSFNI